MVPVINKPTRVTKNTAAAIDQIVTNSLLQREITPEGKVQFTKRLINNKTEEMFQNALQEMTWDDVISSNQIEQTESAYELSSINSLLFMTNFLKNMWLR